MTLIVAVGIATGCVYALVGVGYSLIYRTTGIVNFAQGSFVALGGMSAYWLLDVVRLPYPVALVLALALATLSGLLLWVLIVLPIWRRRSEPVSVMMATLVVAGLAGALLQKWLGTQPRTLPDWLPGVRIALPGATVTGQFALLIVATVVLVGAIGALLRYSTLGRSMRACAASRDTSALLGISPERIGAFSMAATAAVGGLGGILIAPAQYTSTDATTYGIFGFVAAVLGGFGTLRGPVVGGMMVGLLQAFVGRYLSAQYETVMVFALLLVLLTLRPQGLLGSQWSEH
jgi:branched-chain amino acid transport system permease protein